jgi:hypothetical protein
MGEQETTNFNAGQPWSDQDDLNVRLGAVIAAVRKVLADPFPRAPRLEGPTERAGEAGPGVATETVALDDETDDARGETAITAPLGPER